MLKLKYLYYTILIALILITWQLLNGCNITFYISTPSQIFHYFESNLASLFKATWITFLESFFGLTIATIFSLLTMMVCLYFPKLLDFVLPIFITTQVIPLLVFAPLFVMIFNIGITAKVMMAALMCFFPIFVNFANGIKLIPHNVLELAYVFNATKTQKIFKIFFPLSLPNIFTGLKISSTLAVIGSIVSEFTGADVGLGKNFFIAGKHLDAELMMSSLLMSSILGGVLYILILTIEKIFGQWYLIKK